MSPVPAALIKRCDDVIPLCTPDLRGNEARYLQDCIDSTFVSSVGTYVTRMEEMVAAHTGSNHAVAVSSGTTALHAALMAVGVGRDDLVVLPSFTFIASANAISHCGAEPWLFDVTADSWTLDPELLSQQLASQTERQGGVLRHKPTGRRVAAILPVFTLGLPADMDAICSVAQEYQLPVVADAAAAIGTLYKGRPVGATPAELSCLSFNGNKTVTAGGGGAIVGNDAALMQLVRHITTTARVGRDYDHDRVGFNYRMTNIAAAVGCAQMERADELVEAKRRIRGTYDDAFRDLPQCGLFPRPDWALGSCWFSGIVTHDAATAQDLRTHLGQHGIEARSFWKPMHLQQPYRASPATRMQVSGDLWEKVITLPCSTHLTDADQDRVIGEVLNFFKAR